MISPAQRRRDGNGERPLLVYLLPRLPWESVLALQQRLVYDMGEEPRRRAALILCEHSPVITVGRQGSYQHLRMDASEISTGQVPVRWSNRGGGCWHQQPGQLAAYPIVPLSTDGLGLADYRTKLYQTVVDLLREFKIAAVADRSVAGICVQGRQIASMGIAVKQWVTYHGCMLNVCVPLDRQPLVMSSGSAGRDWTCMFRELRTPVRVETVRETFLRHFVQNFGFTHYYLSSPPPGVLRDQRRRDVHANAAHH